MSGIIPSKGSRQNRKIEKTFFILKFDKFHTVFLFFFFDGFPSISHNWKKAGGMQELISSHWAAIFAEVLKKIYFFFQILFSWLI